MKPALLQILTFTLLAMTSHAKVILFFPPPLSSYVVYHSNVATALASLGHETWLVLPTFMIKKNLVKSDLVRVLEYGQTLGDIQSRIYQESKIVESFWAGEPSKEHLAQYRVSLVTRDTAVQVLGDEAFLKKIRSLKPDLCVVESIPFNMNMVVLPYMLDIPFALIGKSNNVILAKIPFSPATTPYTTGYESDRMTFLERVKSTLLYLVLINFDIFYDSRLVYRFAPHKPYKSINEIASTAEIFIAEIDHILDYPRTTLPNTILVGGSSASPSKPLQGKFKEFVERSKHGIIVMTFGGSIVDIPPHITSTFLEAFQQVELNVVWRVNLTSPDPTRIMTSQWLPQNDLLGHETTKLFISHCGKNGQYEALYHGVPILCLPIYGDQGYNSERIFVKQLGLYADMRTVSADQLAAMIKQIVYHGNYTQNMKRASILFRELYKVPMTQAAYWLDHVLQYGGQHLRSTGQDMPWYQLWALDVIAFLATVLLTCLAVLLFLVRHCYVLLKRRSSIKAKTKTK